LSAAGWVGAYPVCGEGESPGEPSGTRRPGSSMPTRPTCSACPSHSV